MTASFLAKLVMFRTKNRLSTTEVLVGWTEQTHCAFLMLRGWKLQRLRHQLILHWIEGLHRLSNCSFPHFAHKTPPKLLDVELRGSAVYLSTQTGSYVRARVRACVRARGRAY